MREEEFRQWMQNASKRDGTPYSGRSIDTYVSSLRIIENALADLGSLCSTLEEVWEEDDRFAGLLRVLEQLKQDAETNQEGEYRTPFPTTDNPDSYLPPLITALHHYSEFLSGESQHSTEESEADRIRDYVLKQHIEPARKVDRIAVEVSAREVCDALDIKDTNCPNVDQALTGSKFRRMAKVKTVERIGKKGTTKTIFLFHLDSEGAHLGEDSPSTDTSTVVASRSSTMSPVNLILYGPPGTGKTYATAAEAVRLCGEEVPEDRDALMKRYGELRAAGRIEFVTFHQSTAYEEFVEGLRPTTESDKSGDEGSTRAGFRLKTEPGIFRRIASHASELSLVDRRVFKISIGDSRDPEDAKAFEEFLSNGYAYFGHRDVDFSDGKFAAEDEIRKAYEATGQEDSSSKYRIAGRMTHLFRNEVKQGDILVVGKGNRLFRAIGLVEGDYEYRPLMGNRFVSRRKVRKLWHDVDGVPVSEIYSSNFVQKTIYELSKNELNVSVLESYMNRESKQPHVLIIDEINRANISRVFGELITLLEPDKRIGAENELLVTLPYSRDKFGVPANLHVLGTMNTADRSIALLDTALRRRFQFRELMPDPELLSKNVDGIDLQKLLRVLNERIEYLDNREHQIGHAYFMHCESKADVDEVMRHKVIPLLSEYFFDNREKVAAVLGDADDNTEQDIEGGFMNRTKLTPPSGLGAEHDDTPRYRWTVRTEDEGFDYSKLMEG